MEATNAQPVAAAEMSHNQAVRGPMKRLYAMAMENQKSKGWAATLVAACIWENEACVANPWATAEPMPSGITR